MTWVERGRTLLRNPAIRLAAAAVVGAVTGMILFAVTRVSGLPLFVVVGGVAGIVTALAMQFYLRAARLTEVKVAIPQFSELTFLVNNDARQTAWKLFVETATRISTQPLGEDEGFVREALTSLYGLFATTREVLKASRPSGAISGGQTVEHLAVTMLNRELRPFLAKWHPRLRRFEQEHPEAGESAWPDNAACRAELREVQQRMYAYAVGFARLAGVRDAEEMLRSG